MYPLGPIGVFVNGVVMFNALDDAGRDADAHEVQDSCDGHPQGKDIYHYHDLSACLATAANSAPGSSTLVGYALNGYGVYVERDAQGNLPIDADLDACHGRTSTVMWDGKPTNMYHYDVTLEYPYFVGCFYGSPVVSSRPGP
ncbi:MAG: YHYH protein [Nocardioidaceae bacterium]